MTETKKEDDSSFQSNIDFTCPFCKGSVSAGYTVHPEKRGEEKKVPAMLHSMPPCAKFNELELDEFLRACRKKMTES